MLAPSKSSRYLATASEISLILINSSAEWEREDSPGPNLKEGKCIRAWSLNVGLPNGFMPMATHFLIRGCRNLWDAGKKPMSYDERNYELWGRKLWLIFLTIQDEKTKMREKVPIVVQKVAFLGTFCTTIGLLANETYYHALSCLRYTLCHSILA